MQAYNGYAGQYREKYERLLNILVDREEPGFPKPPAKCCACDQTEGVCWHQESYSELVTGWPLCMACHLFVHARFRHPKKFFEYREIVSRGGTFAPVTSWMAFQAKFLSRPAMPSPDVKVFADRGDVLYRITEFGKNLGPAGTELDIPALCRQYKVDLIDVTVAGMPVDNVPVDGPDGRMLLSSARPATVDPKVVLVEIRNGIVVNWADVFNPTTLAHDIQKERYNGELLEKLSRYNVIILADRDTKHAERTLGQIEAQTGFAPAAAFFKDRSGSSVDWKRQTLYQRIYPKYGNNPRDYVAIEPDIDARRMFKTIGIEAYRIWGWSLTDLPWDIPAQAGADDMEF